MNLKRTSEFVSKLFAPALGLAIFLVMISFKTSWAQSVVYLQAKKEQAAVFSKPDFDEKIIYLLPKDKKVLGTRSTVEGLNGLGLFHKVKLNSKTYGYVLDTEVSISKDPVKKKSEKVPLADESFSESTETGVFLKDLNESEDVVEEPNLSKKEKQLLLDQEKLAKKNELKKNIEDKNKKEEKLFSFYGDSFDVQKKKKHEGPLFFSTLVGAQIGLINYTEKTQSGKKSSQELVYGLKLSGPNLIFRNFLVDLSFSFHFGAPDFFNDFSSDPSGFLILTDLTFPFILSRTESRYVYGGLGPILSASFFDFVVAGQDESSRRIRLGAVGTLGLAYELGDSWGFKAEGKYYMEGSSYWGVLAGIQKRF